MDQEPLCGFMRTMSLTAETSESIDENSLRTLGMVDTPRLLSGWLALPAVTVPKKIDEAIKELMVLYEQEQAGNLGGPGAYRLQTLLLRLCIGFYSENYPIPVRSYTPLTQLQWSEMTIPILRLLFPHFCNLHHMNTCAEPSVSRIYSIVQNPEFGGILLHGNPTEWLANASHRKIELLHIYCLCRTNPSRSTGMHVKFYKLRNEKSLLHDSQRFRILVNCGIVLDHANLTPRMNEAFERIGHWVSCNPDVIAQMTRSG